MSSLARMAASDGAGNSASNQSADIIPLILAAMSENDIGQRKLALKTGISKSRLGLLLHSKPDKRGTMSLCEFKRILDALDINIVQAVIAIDACIDASFFQDQRFATSIAMMAELFRGLPAMLMAALDEIEGMDGTEVRKEWAGPLRQALVDKLVKEVSAVMTRRAELSEVSRLGL
ncbi:MAG TPA: XRE family transcriptional regulator [Sphingobium sp.]|uniref:XRE family transcriptional regulator n=1 Tax=Sphingobium sp. TaxID=1912891 RepID=UPI002ED64044